MPERDRSVSFNSLHKRYQPSESSLQRFMHAYSERGAPDTTGFESVSSRKSFSSHFGKATPTRCSSGQKRRPLIAQPLRDRRRTSTQKRRPLYRSGSHYHKMNLLSRTTNFDRPKSLRLESPVCCRHMHSGFKKTFFRGSPVRQAPAPQQAVIIESTIESDHGTLTAKNTTHHNCLRLNTRLADDSIQVHEVSLHDE